MKPLIFAFFLISSSIFSQINIVSKSTVLGTIAAEKLNIVYRGIRNPLSIAVADSKSFIATGNGLFFENGRYYLSPGQGNESIITLKIIKNDGTEINENHYFRIKNIPKFYATINDKNCINCLVQMTKEELENAVISTTADDFPIDLNFKVRGFSVKFNKRPLILCEGNTFNSEVISQIRKAKISSVFTISKIQYRVNFDGCVAPVIPIQVQIIPNEIPFFEADEFKKDSLSNLKKIKKLERKSKRKN